MRDVLILLTITVSVVLARSVPDGSVKLVPVIADSMPIAPKTEEQDVSNVNLEVNQVNVELQDNDNVKQEVEPSLGALGSRPVIGGNGPDAININTIDTGLGSMGSNTAANIHSDIQEMQIDANNLVAPDINGNVHVETHESNHAMTHMGPDGIAAHPHDRDHTNGCRPLDMHHGGIMPRDLQKGVLSGLIDLGSNILGLGSNQGGNMGNRPNQGGNRPGQGGSRPGQGGNRPVQGGYRPNQGGYRPNQGGYRPGQGAYNNY